MLGIKETLTKLMTEKILHFETNTGSATINGNTNGVVVVSVPSVSGYTVQGIVVIQNSHGANFAITDYTIIDVDSARVILRNLTSTAATVTVTVKFMYVRNGRL